MTTSLWSVYWVSQHFRAGRKLVSWVLPSNLFRSWLNILVCFYKIEGRIRWLEDRSSAWEEPQKHKCLTWDWMSFWGQFRAEQNYTSCIDMPLGVPYCRKWRFGYLQTLLFSTSLPLWYTYCRSWWTGGRFLHCRGGTWWYRGLEIYWVWALSQMIAVLSISFPCRGLSNFPRSAPLKMQEYFHPRSKFRK